MRELGGCQPLRFLGIVIEREPEEQPEEPHRSHHDERCAPAPNTDDHRDDRGRDDRADVRAGVEQRGRERALIKGTLDVELGWTNAQYGLANTFFQGAYAVSLLLFGKFIDRLV